jgi:hypothetical protein
MKLQQVKKEWGVSRAGGRERGREQWISWMRYISLDRSGNSMA